MARRTPCEIVRHFRKNGPFFFTKKQENCCAQEPDALTPWERPAPVSRVEHDKEAKIKSHFTCAVPHER